MLRCREHIYRTQVEFSIKALRINEQNPKIWLNILYPKKENEYVW